MSTLAQYQTERQFQAAVREYGELCGWKVRQEPMHRSTMADPGFPDLVFARAGAVLFVECKVGKNRLSRYQQAWAEAIGEQWRLWTPESWPEIERILR